MVLYLYSELYLRFMCGGIGLEADLYVVCTKNRFSQNVDFHFGTVGPCVPLYPCSAAETFQSFVCLISSRASSPHNLLSRIYPLTKHRVYHRRQFCFADSQT